LTLCGQNRQKSCFQELCGYGNAALDKGLPPGETMGRATPKRVYVIDDHPVLRRGIVELINSESDLDVCGQAGNGTDALNDIEKSKPDAVLVDLSLGKGASGLEVIKEVHSQFPKTRILVLSMMDESAYAGRSLRAGAHGFVRKDAESDVIIQELRKVLAGNIALSPEAMRQIVEGLAGGRQRTGSLEALTNRQLEVFRLLGEGCGTREIAKQLQVSMKTVDSHRENIKAKLGISDGNELVRTAISWVHRLHS
jgi:DNA-binding NarL/FixJ family response regulator